MTPSDRGPDQTDAECLEAGKAIGEKLGRALADPVIAVLNAKDAEIQRLTGELAQARRELREQDLEADRLTRELIQAQVELAQAREERDAAQAWAREQSMEEREVRTELTALQASQQGLREALEKLRTFAGHDIDCIEQVFSAGCNCGFEAIDQQVTAALAASPVGTAQDPT
jgi:chromosome segregation ATPase